jgi:hypothetical protein
MTMTMTTTTTMMMTSCGRAQQWTRGRQVRIVAARLRRVALAAVLASVLAPAPASAQETIREVVRFLVTNQAVQTDDFVRDVAAADAASETIGQSLLASLATLPSGASSAGFTYRFNPALGTVERASDSFGPAYVERALTSGRGQFAFGATWQYAQFTRLDGRGLREGTLVTTANRFLDEPQAFDVETLTLDLSTTVVTGFATIGVTDRFDVGVAVPFVWLELEGSRLNNYRGTTALQAAATARATGFGDAAIRGKYALFEERGNGLAIGAEVVLPTGRDEDLLGAGRSAMRVMAIGSAERNRIGLHGNLGFGWGGISDALTFSGAMTFAATPRVTLAAELVGQRLADVGRITDLNAPHPSIGGVETIRLAAETLGVNAVAAAGSLRWNLAQTWLLRASLLVPATDTGLTARARMTIGFDYAFAR